MAYVSPKMGLTVWNGPLDLFNHDQLAKNMAKIDVHDHTEQRGVQIPTEGLFDTAVTPPKLDRNYLAIGQPPTVGTGKRSGTVGTSPTFSANNTSGIFTVTHNWGLTGIFAIGFTFGIVASLSTPVTIQCTARTANSASFQAVAGASISGTFETNLIIWEK